MASEQARRENVADQRNTKVEKVVVPKMRTHYESLAEKAKSPQGSPGSAGSAEKVHHYETLPVEVGETKDEQGKKWGGERRQGPSLEEISELRGTAQQNSMEAIRAAEERYEKAKESCASALQKTGESAGRGKDNVLQGIQTGSQYIADKSGALKDTAVGKGQQAKDYTAQKAVEAKDSISSKGEALKDTAVETGQQVKDFTAKKTVETKDAIASTGQSAAGYAADEAKAAKDTTVHTTTNVASYVGDRAAAAKDATVESVKGAAGYAGKVATEAKDQAVATGWGATHYTLEKAAEATKAVAGVTSSVAGYTGEKTVAAKDKVAGAGQTVVDYAGEKLAAAKDAVIASHEKAAEYAGTKKAEAQKDLEAKKASYERGERGETFETRAKREAPTEKFFHGEDEDEQMPRTGSGGGGGVFQAIGETLMEIGQTTKDLLVGQYPIRVLEQKDRGSKDREDEPYRGTGEGI
ncbi:uncharacterized protein LOC142527561 [Primulina tabacum]|uniref:uncharacterized protein LOC142527561 n=1 Tax=Primulina tabacum TaxID=48773 RepID=UPI003F59A463